MQRRFRDFLALAITFAFALSASDRGPEALVTAEHAFASDAARMGTRDAFLAHLAPDGIVFTDRPVNGVELYRGRPSGRSRLAWEPDVAVLSAGGDMGWTSGPWWWRPDSSARPQAFGRFFTIWRRGPDGWKAVLDGGVSHDSLGPPTTVSLVRLRGARGAGAGARASLAEAESSFVALAAEAGMGAALGRAAHPDLRVLRDGHRAFAGLHAADSVAALESQVSFTREALFASGAGDLGYAYGRRSTPGEHPDTASWVRVWQRDDRGTWRVAVDSAIPGR